MPKAKQSKPPLHKKYSLLYLVVVVFAIGGWFTYKSLQTPLGIHQVATWQDTKYIAPETAPQICAQIYGTCLSYDRKCVTYADSCQQSKLCSQPLRPCDPSLPSSPIPKPTLTPYPTSTPKPSPTSIPTSTSKPTPTPYPTSTPLLYSGDIAQFQAANPCGSSHFYNYTVVCSNGLSKNLTTGSCVHIDTMFATATKVCKNT